MLRLVVEGPVPGLTPELVKGLSDGVVCALHAQPDGEGLGEIAERISVRLGVPAEDVRAALVDERFAVLGVKPRLVGLRASYVQWAPDDHLCVAVEVLLRRRATWRVSGSAFEAHPAVVRTDASAATSPP